ncbi:MAG: transposase family protein [Crocinitomicaceae bacterium]|nr:transposase family protein [Crocinitomicaceae bacterium]
MTYALRLDISERTLRNWKRYAMDGTFPKTGRPSMKEEERNVLKLEMKKEWINQGKPGWRNIKASKGNFPTRLIQESLSEFKFNDRRSNNYYKKELSSSLEVLHKDIIWSQDTTFNKGGEVAIEVIKDRGSLKFVSATPISTPSAEVVRKVFISGSEIRGYPLVLMTDNGSGYKSREFKKYLDDNQIIHLRSLPRCPQHNGAVERAIRELKYVINACDMTLELSVETLNCRRKNASKNYLTSDEYEKNDTLIISKERRSKIYCSYQKKILILEKDVPNRRKRKLIERKYVFDLLEKEGLVKQRVGSLKL